LMKLCALYPDGRHTTKVHCRIRRRSLSIGDMKGAALAMLAVVLPVAAQAQQSAEGWTFALTPYVWLPNVDGTLKYSPPPGQSGAPEVRVGPNDYLENLQLALMLAGEARKGKWSIVSDAVYLDFGSEKSDLRAVNFGGSVVNTSLNTSTQSS